MSGHLDSSREHVRDAIHQLTKAQRGDSNDAEHDAGNDLIDAARDLLSSTAVYLDPDELLDELRQLCADIHDGTKKERLRAASQFADVFPDLDDLLRGGAARPTAWHPFGTPASAVSA
jgi:hypothetical protein